MRRRCSLCNLKCSPLAWLTHHQGSRIHLGYSEWHWTWCAVFARAKMSVYNHREGLRLTWTAPESWGRPVGPIIQQLLNRPSFISPLELTKHVAPNVMLVRYTVWMQERGKILISKVLVFFCSSVYLFVYRTLFCFKKSLAALIVSENNFF